MVLPRRHRFWRVRRNRRRRGNSDRLLTLNMPAPSEGSGWRHELRRTLGEALAVAGLGLALALVANAVSPRGLKLGRDYFPAVASVTNVIAASSVSLPAAPMITTNQNRASEVAARLAGRGLRLIESAEAKALFRDPRREQELVVFIDARNDRHYLEGHIPGAYQFDHYYPENHLPVVLPACQQAEIVVVYCGGGDCEDSEFAALALKDAGISAERLVVYGGGIKDWTEGGLPIEVGPRGSGNVTGGTP